MEQTGNHPQCGMGCRFRQTDSMRGEKSETIIKFYLVKLHMDKSHHHGPGVVVHFEQLVFSSGRSLWRIKS